MTEVGILIIGLLINGLGILGCIIPGLPGPVISWCSLLLFFLIPDKEICSFWLTATGIVMLIVSALDYIVPILGAKRFGSSREGVWGGIIGIFVGLFFFPPFGIILGPLIGTIVGDLIAGGTLTKALNSGLGSMLGFIIGTSIKLLYCGAILLMFTWNAGEAVGTVIYQLFN